MFQTYQQFQMYTTFNLERYYFSKKSIFCTNVETACSAMLHVEGIKLYTLKV